MINIPPAGDLTSAKRENVMFTPGIWQMLIVLLVVMLLFGTRLPSLARSLGLSITEFKKGVKGVEDQSGSPSEEK